MSQIPLLDLQAQYQTIADELRDAVDGVMRSQQFILGPTVTAFETAVAAYCRCDHAIGVSSGTDALLASLMAEGIGAGDEVITTAYSFFATAGSIQRLGAVPIFVDIDPRSYNIDPARIEAAISPRTKAIIPVHLYGQMAEMTPIMALARDRGLIVIEDAAQAIGAEYRGQRAGSIGDYGCFSFFPSKNLGGAGDGGLVTCRDAGRAAVIRDLRVHGGQKKYCYERVGGNFRLDALQAAILDVKLRHLDHWTSRRQVNAERYRRGFADVGVIVERHDGDRVGGLVLPTAPVDGRHVYNQFIIRVDDRDALSAQLKAQQIGHAVYYPIPLHRQPCFGDLPQATTTLPESERAALQTLALPIYPELTEAMIDRVIDVVGRFVIAQRDATKGRH